MNKTVTFMLVILCVGASGKAETLSDVLKNAKKTIADLRAKSEILMERDGQVWKVANVRIEMDLPVGDHVGVLLKMGSVEGLELICNDYSWISKLKNMKSLRNLHMRNISSADVRSLVLFEQLEILSLDGRDTPSIDPRELIKLNNLRTLDIFGAEYDDESMSIIRNMKKMQVLKFGNASLAERGIKYLSELPELRTLRLGYVNEEGVKSLSGLRNLENLEIGRVTMSGDALDLTCLHNLKTLHIGGAAGSKESLRLKTIRVALPENIESIVFNQERNAIKYDVRNCSKLNSIFMRKGYANNPENVKWIISLPSLRAISIDMACDNDVELLSGIDGIRHISVGGSCDGSLGDRGLKLLGGFPNLESVSFDASFITDEGMKHIKDIKKLRNLKISCGSEISEKGLANIWECRQLTSLELRTYDKMPDIPKHVAKLDGLEELTIACHFKQNELSMLSRLTKLRHLDLRYCDYRDEELVSLCNQLPGLKTIRISYSEGIPRK